MSKQPALKSKDVTQESQKKTAAKRKAAKKTTVKKAAVKKAAVKKKAVKKINTKKKPAQTAATADLDDRLNLPKPVRSIYDEHVYTCRMLRLLELEAENVLSGGEADVDGMSDILHYITYHPDRFHHPKEDVIFDRMSRLSADMKQTIARLRSDHESMTQQSVDLYERMLEQKEVQSVRELKKLAKEILEYSELQREHMALEEQEIFLPSQKALSRVDWEQIEEEVKAKRDPIFGGRVSSRYLNLLERYLNDFNAISDSGGVPIRRAEAILIRLEKALHFTKKLGKQCGSVNQATAEALKSQLGHIRGLIDIRDRESLDDWLDIEKQVNKENWTSIKSTLEDTRKLFEKPTKRRRHSNRRYGPIEVKSSGKTQKLKEKPYKASGRTRVSWQAALTNVAFRLTLKPYLGRMDNGDGLNLPMQKMPAAKFPHYIDASEVDTTEFKADWLVPKRPDKTRGTILYIPGGGFIFPAGNGHRTLLGRLAAQTQCKAMMVHYRLMPDHPFPSGLEDVLAAYRYLLDEGTPPQEIMFAGDSAGGCLTLSLLMAIRDEGLPMPGAVSLISPVTDLTFSTAARRKNRWRDSSMPSFIRQNSYKEYAVNSKLDDPLISPIFGSFEGLPPIFALVSSSETLLDDTLVVARKARVEGVDFEVEVWESLPHAWPAFPFIPEAATATENIGQFFNRYLDLAVEAGFKKSQRSA